MDTSFQAHLTFHLSGRHSSPAEPVLTNLRPALFARHQPLSALRYDFPLVLFPDGTVTALSAVMDGLLATIAGPGDDDHADRISHHVLRLERRVRELVAQGARGSLFRLWSRAAIELAGDADDQLTDSLARARQALASDGEVIDCDETAPAAYLGHLWKAAQEHKGQRCRQEFDRLIHGLSEILRAEVAASPAGLTAERLRASMGPTDRDAFDFEAMSQLLQPVAAPAVLSDARHDRIVWALGVLRHRRFFPIGTDGYHFAFSSCAAALDAYWARREEMAELLRAVDLARMEIEGGCGERLHAVVAERADRAAFDACATPLLPDYFVEVSAEDLDPAEQQALSEILSAGLPMKVLLRTDDVLDAPAFSTRRVGFGLAGRQLVNTAIGLADIFVLQAPASHLLGQREAVARGLAYTGPALFHVFSGAGGQNDGLCAYLVSAAALESRAFPVLVFDPSAGSDFASRFSIAGNPNAAADWPVHRLEYETAAHQASVVDLPFTFVDFVLCDARYAAHFAPAPGPAADHLTGVAEMLDVAHARPWDRVPAVTAVDGRDRLVRLVVDDVVIEQARRCGDLWRSLQALGGLGRTSSVPDVEPTPPPAEAPRPEAPSVEAKPPGSESEEDSYIETPRCSTCNECIQINNRMFGYNANRQAYIVDRSAGTYRQLVEAAESCQVSIIHPGKPLNPNEPGLDELAVRAAAFA